MRRASQFFEKKLLTALLIVGALLQGGCSARTVDLSHLASLIPMNVQHDVPFIEQGPYECAPVALAMLLERHKVPSDVGILKEMTVTPGRQGTFQLDLISASRRKGMLAYESSSQSLESLLAEVAAGNIPIALLNYGLSFSPLYHYVLVTGYNIHQGTITLQSGTAQNEVISFERFVMFWERAGAWSLLVLPPGQIPESASQRGFLQAALGLEWAGKNKEAGLSYRAAYERWPGSLTALMGLGNTLYKQGRLEEAKAIFDVAVRKYPDHPLVLSSHNYILEKSDLLSARTD